MLHNLWLKHLSECIFDIPVSSFWHIRLIDLSFENVISILMRLVFLWNVFVLLEAVLVSSIVVCACIVFWSCSCICISKSTLLLLKIYIYLLVVLWHIFVWVCIWVWLVCHYNYLLFLNCNIIFNLVS
jgi:hypothetical protein